MKTAIANIFLILLALPGAADAGAEPQTLRVAMTGNYMPLHGMEGGQPVGFEADLARLLAESMGRQIQFLDRNDVKAGALAAVASGQADVALNAVTPTPERALIVDFTAPVAMLEYRVAGSAAGNPGRDFALGCSKSVAIAYGPGAWALRESRIPQKTVVTKSTKAAVSLLGQEKVDCVIGEDIDLFFALAGTDLTVFDEAVGYSPISIAVPKGQKSVYDAVLDKIDDKVEALRRRWNLRAPEPGLVYPKIAFSRIPSNIPKYRYIVTHGGKAYASASPEAPVLADLHVGDVLVSRKPAKATDQWIQAAVAGKPGWIPADIVADISGSFISLSTEMRQYKERCLRHYEPGSEIPEMNEINCPSRELHTVNLTPAGKILLSPDFAFQVLNNPNPESRRWLAKIDSWLYGLKLAEILYNRSLSMEPVNNCQQECGMRFVADGCDDNCCIDCPDEEEYIGLDKVVASIQRLAEGFLQDQDPEVRRRAEVSYCGFLSENKFLWEDNLIWDHGEFARCGISPDPGTLAHIERLAEAFDNTDPEIRDRAKAVLCSFLSMHISWRGEETAKKNNLYERCGISPYL